MPAVVEVTPSPVPTISEEACTSDAGGVTSAARGSITSLGLVGLAVDDAALAAADEAMATCGLLGVGSEVPESTSAFVSDF